MNPWKALLAEAVVALTLIFGSEARAADLVLRRGLHLDALGYPGEAACLASEGESLVGGFESPDNIDVVCFGAGSS